ncbi:hypothetical protein [Pseudomonas trivialis]|uniref:DUF3077 domain-containing protein n=1 Tax=Pseudomonas trivialis TaxID=200450 RepID=A0A0H5AAB4_9PSED|nr:hypothetical protein [Pseudomonas trivialis]AKS06958.1 hypothetical protein AA957_12815 [Pseudomonas trivialis]
MSHPKNTNNPPPAQAVLLTDAFSFHQMSAGDAESSLLQVRQGKEVRDALELSSMLAHSAVVIMERLSETGMKADEIYGVRFLVQASVALIDSSVHAVEFGNRQGVIGE